MGIAVKAKNDTDALKGTWRLLFVEIEGRRSEPPPGVKWERVFNGHQVIDRCWDGKENPMMTAKMTFTLDERSEPKRIDFSTPMRRNLGIYRLVGKMLTIVVDEAGRRRPTEFAGIVTDKGQTILYQFERVGR
jgi:uncharacterized protein (TIGR03067 family)